MRATAGARTLHLFASALLAGALIMFLAGSTTRVSMSEAVSPSASAATSPLHTEHSPKPRRMHSRAAESTTVLPRATRNADASKAADLFATRSWYSPPPPPAPTSPPPVAAPTAPPLPFTFLGSYTDGTNATVYFVAREDRVYDVKPGDAIDATYTVQAVENGQLVFTYKPLNERQLLPIGDTH